jgi:hypothetical protein
MQVDFWHPELSDAEKAAVTFVYDLQNKFESGLVPFWKPKVVVTTKSNGGLGGWWKSITGSG